MMNASQYGNAFAYVVNNFNNQTGYMLGQNVGAGTLGQNKVTVYSVFREPGGAPATQAHRRSGPGLAVVGWHGPRPVAFPLTDGWNFDLPLT